MTPDLVRRFFRYENGALIWTDKPAKKVVVGNPAGSQRPDGYSMVRVLGKRDYLHRLIWIWHNGAIPDGYVVDHIDRDPTNNRIENLRLLTHTQNLLNTGPQRNNPHGFRGIVPVGNRWQAKSQRKYLGSFATKEEAHAAYQRHVAVIISPGGS